MKIVDFLREANVVHKPKGLYHSYIRFGSRTFGHVLSTMANHSEQPKRLPRPGSVFSKHCHVWPSTCLYMYNYVHQHGLVVN